MITRREFLTPTVAYRPVIFWSWNGSLEPDRLRRQIRSMKEAGIGGFFMHARVGMQTPYLQEEWFELVRVCIDEAKRQEMQAWLYDEYGYPSGFAGGAVPRLGREYRAKALLALSGPVDDETHRLLYAEPDRGVYYYEWTSPLGNPRFMGGSGVDLMHPPVVQAFIESTHVQYAGEIGEAFGAAVPGIFSDEASLMMGQGGSAHALPWSEGLDKRFAARYGYELGPHFAALFHPRGDDWQRVRYDYWRLLVDLLVDHYSKPIYEWCEQNGLSFTGHYMGEDHMWKIMRGIGDPMPHYAYMHIPGMDYLGRQIHKSELELCESGGTVMTARQVTSVANQLDKPRVLSELFGGAGHTFDLRMQKWMIDWHLVHGVNLFTPHLLPYSMLGEAKRDWPPVIGPQQPWWKHAGKLNDYAARMSYALSQGKRVVQLLVIHPMESAWVLYQPSDLSEVEALSEQLSALCLKLLDAQVDFDFGSESILEEHGGVEGRQWRVGSSRYDGVVIPSCVRLRPSTLQSLRTFGLNGGPIWQWDTAEQVAARLPELAELSMQPFDPADIRKELNPDYELRGSELHDLWTHERLDQDVRRLFISNLSLERRVRAIVRFKPGSGTVLYRWDAETGEVEPFPSTVTEGGLEAKLELEPTQSILLELVHEEEGRGRDGGFVAPAVEAPDILRGSRRQSSDEVGIEARPSREASIPLDGFQVVDGDDNLLVVDQFEAWDERAGRWREAEWAFHVALDERTTRVRTTVRAADASPLDAVKWINEPGICSRIYWDGVALARTETNWIDPELEAYTVPASLLTGGLHTVEIELLPSCRVLENMYVQGRFHVSRTGAKQFELMEWKSSCDARDLIRSGYPFFSGSLSLRTVFDWRPAADERKGRWLIHCEDPQHAGVKLTLNGCSYEARIWEPWAWDVTEGLAEGRNEAVFEITGTMRNAFGPHYIPEDERLQYLRRLAFNAQKHHEMILQPFGLGTVVLECY